MNINYTMNALLLLFLHDQKRQKINVYYVAITLQFKNIS